MVNVPLAFEVLMFSSETHRYNGEVSKVNGHGFVTNNHTRKDEMRTMMEHIARSSAGYCRCRHFLIFVVLSMVVPGSNVVGIIIKNGIMDGAELRSIRIGRFRVE
jgi:hypothetical protein